MTLALSLDDQEQRQRRVSGISCLSAIIEEIGREGFASRMLDYLDYIVGADHCSVFQLKDYELTEVTSACREGVAPMSKSDLAPYDVKCRLSQTRLPSARVDISSIIGADEARTSGLPKRQRIMICAQKSSASYCVRILRHAHRGRIPDSRMDDLREVADLLISLVAQHVELLVRKPNLTPALTSLEEIQECISSATDLSRREGEVCARILYGYSSCGIALDLGIGKETVMTYRKRSYQRLGIGSQRELLMWYLALWSTLHGRSAASDAVALPFTEFPAALRSGLPALETLPVVPALS